VIKQGYSRNGPNNLNGGAGTAGPLLQGGMPKQQMNFTSYESGFGHAANGPVGLGVNKSSR